MVASVLGSPAEKSEIFELLRPDRLANGCQPEERVIHCGISWKRYLALDKKFGNDRPDPRFYYLDGELEIVTTSNEHERIREWIGDFLSDYFLESGIDIIHRGQATMRLALREAGAEPDKSWCIREEKRFPDLVLEIALTSGGLDKLEIYRRFRIPEVWIWRHDKLEVFALDKSGKYEPVRKSRLLPSLDIELLQRCVGMLSWRDARHVFRAELRKRKKG